MNRAAFRRSAALTFQSTWLPLACYYLVAFLIPLANGGLRAGGKFWAHEFAVLAVPLALLGAVITVRYLRAAWRSSRREGEP